MNVYYQQESLQTLLKKKRESGKTVGFVPTMGALHEGHISLIKQAYLECDTIVVSIFVNPTQFDNAEDLKKYPRTIENDVELLSQSFQDVLIYAPEVADIYGNQAHSDHFEFGVLAQQMEGASREGHFDGVGTILKKLFTIIKPDKAYFGEKDYQQLLIVKKLVSLLQYSVEIVGCPINREKNGLARSSRNKRLNDKQLTEASFIYKSLLKAKEDFKNKSPKAIKEEIYQDFERNSFFKLDYFEIANADTLEPVNSFEKDKKYRAFIATWMGEVRLIDNMALN